MSFKDEFLKLPPGPARENLIYNAVISMGPPKNLIPVTVPGPNGIKITYYTMPDVISIDGIRATMTAVTAQRIADHFGMHLPTDKMSKQIWEAADTKIRANPLSASGFTSANGKHFTGKDVVAHKIGDSDASIAYNDATNKELEKYEQHTGKKPNLISGHGKMITQPLSDPNKLSFGGWEGAEGIPLQPYSSPHDAATQSEYASYSRLVGNDVTITKPDGQVINTTLDKLQENPELSRIIASKPGVKKYNISSSNSNDNKPLAHKLDIGINDHEQQMPKNLSGNQEQLLQKIDSFLSKIT